MSDSVEAPLWIKLNVSQAGSRGDEREIPHLHSPGTVWETQAQSGQDLGSRETGEEILSRWCGGEGKKWAVGEGVPISFKKGQLAGKSIQVERVLSSPRHVTSSLLIILNWTQR